MVSLLFVLLFVSCSKEEVASPCNASSPEFQQRSMDDGLLAPPSETDGGGISDDGNDDGDKERNRKTKAH
jgi:hypothetical protein